MFGTLPLLLPLDTLPGWPEAPAATLAEGLWVMVGIPGLIGVVVTAIVMGPVWFRGSRPASDAVATR